MLNNWIVTATYAGNLQNFPLVGIVKDYKQLEPGLITVAIRCTRDEVSQQVDRLVGSYTSEMTIVPDLD